MKNASYEIRPSGAALVTIDMEGGAVNVMNDAFLAMFDEVLDRLEAERDTLSGVIVTSGKSTFVAGGDIAKILQLREQGADAGFAFVQSLKAQLRRLETLGVPVVAALNGSALGGGLELALAAHRRISVEDPKTQFGFPEVGLGLLPGGGGIVRSVRMLGLMKALPLLTEGRKLGPAQALEAGLIDEIVADKIALIERAEAWIAGKPETVKPWDKKGFAIPGGDMFATANAGAVAMFPSMIFKKTKGLLPAAERILTVAAESTQVGFDAACHLESRAFAELLMTPAAENLIRTMFLQMNEINAGASRPSDFERRKVRTIGVLGAGMMGRGIAYSAAISGLKVFLKDISLEAAEKGKDYSRGLLDKAVERGKRTTEDRDATLALITPTAEMADLADCDLVVEAVFEDVALKHSITREVESVLGPDAVVATNTSTLPISMLAEASGQPDKFIGLHFFSPVDKMHIVEIICGNKTSPDTLALAFDFVQSIRKTPIIVNDSRGFFTSRVFSVFADEGDRLLKDGVNPVIIENLARQIGMPVGPLAVQDEVMMDMLLRSFETNRALDEQLGDNYASTYEVCGEFCEMMSSIGRPGRSAGAGFYDYDENGSKTLWPGLKERFGGDTKLPLDDIRDRLLFRMVVEAARCLDESVVANVRDGNVGSILAFGFPVHTGGVFQFIESRGVDAFITRASELAETYGPRFQMPRDFQSTLDRASASKLKVPA